MITLLELYNISPDKYNDESVIYHEDLVDILEAKKMILKGEAKRARLEAGRQRARSKHTTRR